jgi:predicted Zn-dependent peptidase
MKSMKRTLLLAGAWAGLLSAAEIVSHPRLLKFEPLNYEPPKAERHRHVLSNGAAVYLVEDHVFPLVTVAVTIRTGQYLDPPDKIGVAAMTGEQIRSGGTEKRKPRDFDEEVDFLAANITSAIGDTQGSASLNCLSRNLDAALDLFFEMLRTPGFDPEQISLYKARRIQAMSRRNDQTNGIEQREWDRLLRGTSHFSTAQDTKASIDAITREDLLAFHRQYYHPANFIFAVSGDFDSKAMLAKLEAATRGWPGAKAEVPPVPKPNHKAQPGVYLVNKPEVNQCRVSIGHVGVTRDNPDHYAVGILNSILGGGAFTSRIMSRVRSDEGLAYSAGSTMPPGVYYEGDFRAYYQSKSATCAQAAAIVLEEIRRIRSEKVSGEELSTAVNYAVEVFPRFFATPGIVAGTFAADEYTRRPPGYWDAYRQRMRAVTADDVLRVAQKYLKPEELVILAVGNAGDILKGDPTKPQYSFEKMGPIRRIALPDPMTMVYPAQ